MRSYKKHRPRMAFETSNGVKLFVYGITVRPCHRKIQTSVLWRWENDRHRKMRESPVRYDWSGKPYMWVGSERRSVYLDGVRGV